MRETVTRMGSENMDRQSSKLRESRRLVYFRANPAVSERTPGVVSVARSARPSAMTMSRPSSAESSVSVTKGA